MLNHHQFTPLDEGVCARLELNLMAKGPGISIHVKWVLIPGSFIFPCLQG